MPVTKSAEKALRQSLRRKIRNLQKKEAYKDATKKIKKLVAAGKTKEAEAYLPHLYKVLDKTSKTGLIKKNKAGRLKSRLTLLVRKTG